jgi:hypothetical protein
MKREKEDEEEDKKVVVPPVNHHLQPATNHNSRIQDARAQGRRKALRLHATNRAQNSACARCPPSPCPLGAWEVSIEPQLERSIPPSAQAVAAAAGEGQLVGWSSPERALRHRGGGGTSLGRGHSHELAGGRGAHEHRCARRWRQLLVAGGGRGAGVLRRDLEGARHSGYPGTAEKACSTAKWVSSGEAYAARGGGTSRRGAEPHRI